jgi:capsular exopolysaccharide synthesis family protein
MIKQTLATKSGRDRRISLFAPASVPVTPTWLGLVPTTYWREINVIIGLILGLIAGVALAFLYDYVDSRLYTKEQIEAVAGVQTLAQIPNAKQAHRLLTDRGTVHGEAFRYLRTAIFFDHGALPRLLLVTSAMPGEGKSTVVANLALAIAQSRHNVIVVDADLRLPTLHQLFNLPTTVGLSSILQQECSVADALQATHDAQVRVITSGPSVRNPSELLDSPQFARLLEQLRQEADFVLFDSPASLAVSDAAVIAPMMDGVLLVVSRANAVEEAVRTARSQLAAVGANLVGVVVNRVDQVGTYFRRYATNGASAR